MGRSAFRNGTRRRVLNLGAWGWYSIGNVTFTAPSTWFQNGLGMYASATLATGISAPAMPSTAYTKYTSYLNWDVGFGWTWKVLTLDLRYYDTNLSKTQCDAFTSAQNASFSLGQHHGAKPERRRHQLVQRLVHRQALGFDRLQYEPQAMR